MPSLFSLLHDEDTEDQHILPNYDPEPISNNTGPSAHDNSGNSSPNTSPTVAQASTWPQRTSFEREVAQRAILRPQASSTHNQIKPRPRRTASQFALEMLGRAGGSSGKSNTSPLKHSLVPQQSL